MQYKKRIFSKTYKYIFYGLVLLIFQFMTSHKIHADENLKSLKELWREGRYQEVALRLIEYRKSPGGKNVIVDYLLATSLCRIPEYNEKARKYFEWILYHYKEILDSETKELVKREKNRCSPDRPDLKPLIIVRIIGDEGSKHLFSEVFARSVSKKFYWLEGKNAPLTMEPAKRFKDISLDEFKSRIFNLEDREAGISKVKELLGSEFKVDSVGPFILGSSSEHNGSDIKYIGERLEKFIHFFQLNYGMTIPSNFITIYMVPNVESLPELAGKIHGLKISEGSIGYSFQDDLSIVAVIPGRVTGTLAHELFHILLPSNFGDIPAWMEEGMAALYEVSEIIDDKVIGLPNWRGRVLQEFWSMRPSIEKLVKMDWASFNNAENNYEAKQQAANHAMARYFMLYLQKEGKLVDVYRAFRDRKVEEMRIDPGTDAAQLIQSTLNKPLAEADRDFIRWFNTLRHE